MLATEPTDSRQASEPTEPMDRIEPAEPIDKIDPLEPMDKIEPLEPMDKIEPLEPVLKIDPAEAAERDERSLIAMRSFCRNAFQDVPALRWDRSVGPAEGTGIRVSDAHGRGLGRQLPGHSGARRPRQTVDLDTVQDNLVDTVDAAFQPAHVSVWLPPREGYAEATRALTLPSGLSRARPGEIAWETRREQG
jgi:hypothetical protein